MLAGDRIESKNILLINVPSRARDTSLFLPLGLLYAASIMERCGYKVTIFDPYLDKELFEEMEAGKFERLDSVLTGLDASIVGFGGIVTSYGRAKRWSIHLKERFPKILQIAGGPLASVSEMLLKNAHIDAVFHGETEVSLPIFLEKFGDGGKIFDAPGISYLQGGSMKKNPAPEQVSDLDTIPLPDYGLVDVRRYLNDMGDWLSHYKLTLSDNPAYKEILKRLEGEKQYIPIITARGCTHRCSFCYRHVSGVRQHSVAYVIDHIKYLKGKYGIKGFQLSEELFNAKREWVLEFCDALKKEELNIFYLIVGARVDRIDEEMLRRLKETGCIQIIYGQESGSDTILKEYRKGITAKQNKDITMLTKTVGIYSAIQLVIGSPSETTETIRETIQFLKDLDAYDYSINYLIPLPETPIWRFVQENRLINDVEKYLDEVADKGGLPLVNLTKAPDKVWRGWGKLIRKEMKLHYFKKKGLLSSYVINRLLYGIADNVTPLISSRVKRFIPHWVKSWY